MKKILCLVAALFTVALLSTSCTKNCTCKVWTAGVAAEPYDVELDENYDSCDDISNVVILAGVKSGVECK